MAPSWQLLVCDSLYTSGLLKVVLLYCDWRSSTEVIASDGRYRAKFKTVWTWRKILKVIHTLCRLSCLIRGSRFQIHKTNNEKATTSVFGYSIDHPVTDSQYISYAWFFGWLRETSNFGGRVDASATKQQERYVFWEKPRKHLAMEYVQKHSRSCIVADMQLSTVV